MAEESKLENLKKSYSNIQEKYNLPKFEELNKDFHIEKIAESETELLLSEIRRMLGDKLANYLRFVESLLNPANVPMFIYSIIKSLNEADKKNLSEIYKKLAENEIEFIKLDIEADDAKDAEFIKESFKLWKGVQKDLVVMVGKVEEKKEIKPENNKGYFG